MNKTILICVAVIFHTGCVKREEFRYYGAADAKLNGREWKATKVRCISNQPCYNGKLGFELLRSNSQGFLREIIHFGNIRPLISRFQLEPRNDYNSCNDTLYASFGTLTDDGDVTEDAYEIIDGPHNFLTIDYYNENTKVLAGTFELAFKKIPRPSTPHTPDTIRITNGRFLTRVLN